MANFKQETVTFFTSQKHEAVDSFYPLFIYNKNIS